MADGSADPHFPDEGYLCVLIGYPARRLPSLQEAAAPALRSRTPILCEPSGRSVPCHRKLTGQKLERHVSVSVCGVVWSCGVDVVGCGVLCVSRCARVCHCVCLVQIVLHPAPLSFPNREPPVRFENSCSTVFFRWVVNVVGCPTGHVLLTAGCSTLTHHVSATVMNRFLPPVFVCGSNMD